MQNQKVTWKRKLIDRNNVRNTRKELKSILKNNTAEIVRQYLKDDIMNNADFWEKKRFFKRFR